MFLKILTLIVRRFEKNRSYTAFNVLGLAVGFSVVIYISLFIHHELTYDTFLPSHESVFRISDSNYALTSPAHLGYLKENFDGIQAETYLLNSGNFLIGIKGKKQVESNGYYVTGKFFDVFDYPLKQGSLDSFSELSNSIVITESMEEKLFGQSSGLNKEITLYYGDESDIYEVIAILKDLPSNTHLSFNMLVHMPASIIETEVDNWGYTIYHGYIKTDEKFSTNALQDQVNRTYAQRVLDNNWIEGAKTIEDVLTSDYRAQLVLRLDEIYFDSSLLFDLRPGGDKQNLWIFGATALFILLLAITNFINLSTAQSTKKAKEVGVRKTLGSSRTSLVGQFLSESIFLCMMAALLALGMVEFLIPLMKSFLDFEISFSIISNPINLLFLFTLALLTGILGGLYPALYLTSFRPAAVIKGNLRIGEGGSFLRNALVVFQFVISISLGIFVYIVQDQLIYSLSKDAGFEKENLVVLDNSLNQLGENTTKFKNELLADTRFKSAGYYSYDLIGMSTTFISQEKREAGVEPFRVYYQWTDTSYLSTLEIELIEGKGFSELTASDTSVIILNKTAVKELGLENPLGERIQFGASPGDFEIVGVIEDFHHQSFRKEVPPTAFVYAPAVSGGVAIRLAAGSVSGNLEALEAIWKNNTILPFDYRFIDQDFAQLFEKEQRLSKIISVFTVLAFFVASLGLLGLAGYLAERKTKEIGIRKALGATIEQIVKLFSAQFIKLVLIAMLFAVPLAYLAVEAWLDSFIYRVTISPSAFIIISLSAVLVVIATVSFHAIKSAAANPVKALKEE